MKYQIITANGSNLAAALLNWHQVDLKELELEISYPIPEVVNSFYQKLLNYQGKRVLIIGDYDCDGICATTILRSLLLKLNIDVKYYIPSRYEEGYGLSKKHVDAALKKNIDLLICIDNGISATEVIEYAEINNLKMMIIDHHEYTEIPEVEAVLHADMLPKPYLDLCSAGLAYLLYRCYAEDEQLLAYAGSATLADMVSVFGYNRYLIKEAIKLINEGKARQLSLLNDNEICDIKGLGFSVIPKINAVSRIEGNNVNHVVRYLSEESLNYEYLAFLNNNNQVRKEKTKESVNEAINTQVTDYKVAYYASPNYSKGICGIIAARMLQQTGKPCLVLEDEGELLEGSGRSPNGIDLYQLLLPFKDKLLRFGGHAQAVGLSLSKDNEALFKEYLKNLELSESFQTAMLIDSSDLSLENLEAIRLLEPLGLQLKVPPLAISAQEVISRSLLKGKYLRFEFNGGKKGICFEPQLLKDDYEYLIGELIEDKYSKVSFLIHASQ